MKRKFKIGDNVRVISNPDADHDHNLHDRGVVSYYYSGCDFPYCVIINGSEGRYFPRELTKLQPMNCPEYLRNSH